MRSKTAFAVANLGVGAPYNKAELAREILADALPTLHVLTKALNYAHFKKLGQNHSQRESLEYGPSAVSSKNHDFVPPADFYDTWFTMQYDNLGCSIVMHSRNAVDPRTETTFNAIVDQHPEAGQKGQILVSSSNANGSLLNGANTNDAASVIGQCAQWIARTMPLNARETVATYATRITETELSNRSFNTSWKNAYTA